MEALGRRIHRLLARLLLPEPFRRDWGEELHRTFDERQRDARARRTALALPLLWLVEGAALVRVAYRVRRPDAWARRTARAARPDPQPKALLMDSLAQDLRFALRTFRRRKGMMGLAALCLALGIGASTAMFSVVDSVLLRPLPFDDPEELVRVYASNPQFVGHPTFGEFADRGTLAQREFWWLAENQEVFEAFGGYYGYSSATLSGGDGPPEELSLVTASPDLLEVLGVAPLRGRAFAAEDDPAAGAQVVMLTEDFWRARFGGDPGVVGSTLTLDDEAWTIIGVLPAEVGIATSRTADAWRLFSGSSGEGNWGNHSLSGAVGRLADGVDPARAQAELTRLFAQAPEEGQHEHGASVYPLLQDMTRNARPALLVLLASAGLLLLVGCGNVAAILVGAGIDRETEIAVRGSLGASRGRLRRQLLTESVTLAGVGAAGGVLVAWLVQEGLLFLAPPGLPRLATASLDPRALAFAVVVGVVAGILFGMVPALSLSRPDLAATMGSARGGTSGKNRLQAMVVAGELALATVLLISAGLLGRSLFALNQVDLGLEAEGLYAVRVATPWQRFGGDDGREAAIQYLREVQEAMERVPGVSSVAMTSDLPFTGDRANNVVNPVGWEPRSTDEPLIAERRSVSAGYFTTAGIELVEGRDIEEADDRDDAAPVMVVSEGLARRVWPDEPAVGKQVAFWGRDPYTVVGVATDLRDESATQASTYAFYVPTRKVTVAGKFLVRVAGEPSAVLPALRQSIWSVAPDLPITELSPMTELFSQALDEQRYRARLMVAFAVLAALFALMGVYGVVSRSVARRTREIGIRMALGAPRTSVRRMVARQALVLAVWGVALGLGAGLVASSLLQGLLFGVGRADPLTLVSVPLLVGAASVLAALPSAFRATRVDPAGALRAE